MFALLLCIAIPGAVFAADAQSGYKVNYDGGSLADTKVGSGLKLIINSSTVTFLKDKTETVSIPRMRGFECLFAHCRCTQVADTLMAAFCLETAIFSGTRRT
jgi:hypothetical protein